MSGPVFRLDSDMVTTLFFQPQSAVPDTVVYIADRGGLAMAADGAVVVLALAVLIFGVALLGLMLEMRRAVRSFHGVGRRALEKADPILESGRGVADNVEFISAVVRSDVERLNETVRTLADRLQLASDHMEERIEEFNALMEVVQDEAEDLFLGTAATARGVTEGVRNLRHGTRGAPPDESSVSASAEESETGPHAIREDPD